MMSKRPRIKRVSPQAQLVFMSVNEGYAKSAEQQLRESGKFSQVTTQRRNMGTLDEPFHVFNVSVVASPGVTVPRLEFNRSRMLVTPTMTFREWMLTI